MCCNENSQTGHSYPKSYSAPNNNCGKAPCNPIDSTCVKYTGPDLLCINPPSRPNLEEILLSIDSKVCQTSGSWDGFNYHCLDEDTPITTPGEFVDVISGYVCTLNYNYNNFVTNTYQADKNSLQNQINSIINPNLTTCVGITSSDNYSQIITKLSNKICSVESSLDISLVNWDQCFTVSSFPTSIKEAFDTVVDMICQVKSQSSSAVLPTFNNVGSCLPAPVTTTDSLVTTINKIKARLCSTPLFNIDALNWGCVANPATGDTLNLTAALNSILDSLNTLVEDNVTFNSDEFEVTLDGCNGRTVSLSPSLVINDRLVASDPSDTSPGTLIEKLTAGANITIDENTNPGTVTITAASGPNDLVKSDATDPTAGYLESKILALAGPHGLGLYQNTDTTNHQVTLSPTIDLGVFLNSMFDYIQNDTNLYNRWCEMNCACVPCGSPTTSEVTLDLNVTGNETIGLTTTLLVVQGNPNVSGSVYTLNPTLKSSTSSSPSSMSIAGAKGFTDNAPTSLTLLVQPSGLIVAGVCTVYAYVNNVLKGTYTSTWTDGVPFTVSNINISGATSGDTVKYLVTVN